MLFLMTTSFGSLPKSEYLCLMENEQLNKLKQSSAPKEYKGNNYPFTIRYCPGYEGYIPLNLNHEVCKHCGNIHYYH